MIKKAVKFVTLWVAFGALLFCLSPSFYALSEGDIALTADMSPLTSGNYVLQGNLSTSISIADGADVSICLGGYTLSSSSGATITVPDGAGLTLDPCLSGGTVHGDDVAISVAGSFTQLGATISGGNVAVDILSSGHFSMEGGQISDSAVAVFSLGSFVLNGGTISGNEASPSIIDIQSGDFELKDGEISDNTVSGNGQIVYISPFGQFEMQDGYIRDNSLSVIGRDVMVDGGDMDMSGGAISGTIASDGNIALSGDADCRVHLLGGELSISGSLSGNITLSGVDIPPSGQSEILLYGDRYTPSADDLSAITLETDMPYTLGISGDNIILGDTEQATYSITGTIGGISSPKEALVVLFDSQAREIARKTADIDDGSYAFDRLAPGDYSITITCEGYTAHSEDVLIEDGDKVVNVTLLATGDQNTFIAVSDISQLPTVYTLGQSLTLSGRIVPSNASEQDIVWTVAGNNLGATINGSTFRATSVGSVAVKATIANGKGNGEHFTTTFSINIISPEQQLYTVTVLGSYAGQNGDMQYAQGNLVTLSAGSKYGYDFVGWEVEPSSFSLPDSDSETVTFAMPAYDLTFEAQFEQVEIPLDDGQLPPETGTGGTGGGVEIPIETPPDAPYTLSQGGGNSIASLTPTGSDFGLYYKVSVRSDHFAQALDGALNARSFGQGAQVRIVSDKQAVHFEITQQSLSEFMATDVQTLSFKCESASVDLPRQALTTLSAQGGSLTVTITPALDSELSEQQLLKAQGEKVVNIEIFVGDSKITEFDGGISLSIPAEQSKAIYYLREDGMMFPLNGVYLSAAGIFTAQTDHLSSFVLGTAQVPFTDISASNEHYSAVLFCYQNGLMAGTSATTFSPDLTMTRAMVATILWRASGAPVFVAEHDFSDIAQGVWYTDAVAWAHSEGLMIGTSDSEFSPDQTLSREELITILYRFSDSLAE